ncbi:MAG TPA: hypothetical protein PK614_05565 [Nitrospira sp.]|nr:hypothetical protein [Nitrospira sp.]
MLALCILLLFTQADGFDPGPNPNKDITKPVVDFESNSVKQKLKLANSGEIAVLEALAKRVKDWQSFKIENLSRPIMGKPVHATEILIRYIDVFDMEQLRPWLVKKAEFDGFDKNIKHKIKNLNAAKHEYALMDTDSRTYIKGIYNWIEKGSRVGDLPSQLKSIAASHKNLFDPDELATWSKEAASNKEKMKAEISKELAAEKVREQEAQEKKKNDDAVAKVMEDKRKAQQKIKDDEDKARVLLKAAKLFMEDNANEFAERRLKEIITKYPNTKSVDEAKQLLEKMKK